jgi:hypothetical protein
MVGSLQWVAMVVTVLAAWFVGSSLKRRRQFGFWTYLASNVLWAIWGISAQAWGLVVLQVFLAGMNVRGLRRSE